MIAASSGLQPKDVLNLCWATPAAVRNLAVLRCRTARPNQPWSKKAVDAGPQKQYQRHQCGQTQAKSLYIASEMACPTTLAAVHAPAIRRQAVDSAPSGWSGAMPTARERLRWTARCPGPGSVSHHKGARAMKAKSQTKSVVRRLLTGLVGVLVIGGPAREASAANVCNAALDSMFVSGPNFVVPGDATRDTVRLQLTLGAGTITGAPV